MIVSAFVWNPKAEFTNHIDAPAEVEVLKAQQEIEKQQAEYIEKI